MIRPFVVAAFAAAGLWLSPLFSQTPAQVDFARDVQPILRQNCVGCHGPAQQMNGLRLDRKSSAMKVGARRVMPGSSENSFVYLRLTGADFGAQMPPTGALKPEQIEVLKKWIDQGAEWPEALANEVELPPLNPKAIALVETLRTGDVASFMKSVAADPKLLNARGPEGSTPFMYAVLYANVPTLATLLKLGAEPNRNNDAKATALMWAATNLEKTRLLLDHGANVNARSSDIRTPLMIASRCPGGASIVKLLLERGANPNPNLRPGTESSPLMEAATAGDAEIVQLLLSHGADAKAAGQTALSLASATCGSKCVELLAAKISDASVYTGSLQDIAVYGDIKAVRFMLDHGADVKAFDALGRTALMYAVASDLLPLDVVKLLIERGADVNAKSRHKLAGDTGLTVLDIARLRGDTPIVQALLKAGAEPGPVMTRAARPRKENSIEAAVRDSLRVLQPADVSFTTKTGCASCHNNSLVAMTIGVARKRGIILDERIASEQQKTNVMLLEKGRDMTHQNFAFPVGDNVGPNIFSFVLVGLAAENYKADLDTDAVAMFLKNHQNANGEWPFPSGDPRPPMCSSHVGQTALSMRALQFYAPNVERAAYAKSIQLAASWLLRVKPANTDDLGWRALGLAWAGKDKAAASSAKQDLAAMQRKDGGWSDLPSMESTAYATGKALVALQGSGMSVSDPVYKRGVDYLLRTQQEDGSWYVRTRALAFQPYFDAGFPYGHDQWISAAGTSWAAMALALALPETGAMRASRLP